MDFETYIRARHPEESVDSFDINQHMVFNYLVDYGYDEEVAYNIIACHDFVVYDNIADFGETIAIQALSVNMSAGAPFDAEDLLKCVDWDMFGEIVKNHMSEMYIQVHELSDGTVILINE